MASTCMEIFDNFCIMLRNQHFHIIVMLREKLQHFYDLPFETGSVIQVSR